MGGGDLEDTHTLRTNDRDWLMMTGGLVGWLRRLRNKQRRRKVEGTKATIE